MTDSKHVGAARYIPGDATLAGLASAVQDCRGCDLYERATRAVFGRGRPQARAAAIARR